MGPKQPKRYWRNHPNAFPSGLDPLPQDLTATEIITSYPNHLEDRDVVRTLINDHDLNCGQIYDSISESLKVISTKKLDVNMLRCKAYSARGKKGKEETQMESREPVEAGKATYGHQCDDHSDIEGLPGPKIRQTDIPLILAQPSWTRIGVRCDHPALSTASKYRASISGTSSVHSRTWKNVSDDLLSMIAEHSKGQGSIEECIAMARNVRRSVESGNQCMEGESELVRALVFELTCQEVNVVPEVVEGQEGQGIAKIGGLEKFIHHTI